MARSKKNVIVIPWDYTESCEIALMHAIQLAKEVNNYIMLARFLESPGFFARKSVKEKLILEETEKLKKAGQEVLEKHKINPFIAVELGVSLNNFKKLVTDAKANLMVCGTSYKINEKVTFPIKEIASRLRGIDIPFVVAQEKPAHNYYKEIVVPLDHDKKFKETLQWVVYLSKYYNCNINIIKPFISDEYKKKEMANNIYFTKKLLDKKNIIYGIKTAKKNRQFEEEVLRFAENIDSDLIVMMIRKYRIYLADHHDSKQKIPILVINRNSEIIKYGGSFR